MKLETTRFGTLDIADKQILEFPDGLYGFEKETRFTLLPFNPNVESPMEWMQSILSPHLAFVITDPHLYVPGYKLKLLEEEYYQDNYHGTSTARQLFLIITSQDGR